MLASVPTTLESLRQPEYTGDNRCVPCTAVNVSIAVVLTVLLSVVLTPHVATVAFAIFTATIYFRGYLVPKTPTLTKRYLPERVHRLFGTHTAPEPDGHDDVESLLRSTDVVVDCPGEDDLCLESAFRDAWRERIATLESETNRLEALARRLALEAGELALEDSTGGYLAQYEGDRIGIWPSEAAFLADLAAAPALDEHGSGWQDLTADEQGVVLTGLRAFLEACPTCGGDIDGKEETVESCCSTATRMAVECEGCGAQLLRGTA